MYVQNLYLIEEKCKMETDFSFRHDCHTLPESSSLWRRDDSFSIYLKSPEIKNVKTSINRIEANIDRSYKRIFDKWMETPIGQENLRALHCDLP